MATHYHHQWRRPSSISICISFSNTHSRLCMYIQFKLYSIPLFMCFVPIHQESRSSSHMSSTPSLSSSYSLPPQISSPLAPFLVSSGGGSSLTSSLISRGSGRSRQSLKEVAVQYCLRVIEQCERSKFTANIVCVVRVLCVCVVCVCCVCVCCVCVVCVCVCCVCCVCVLCVCVVCVWCMCMVYVCCVCGVCVLCMCGVWCMCVVCV